MNVLKASGKPLFFEVTDPERLGIGAPPLRRGDAIRTYARSLSVMQKEALVVSARTGAVWRLASDEGAYLDGYDEAPCPLSFLTTGMVCSYYDEICALAKIRGIAIASLKLIQDNYYTMRGSALKGTMTGGAKDVELEAVIDSDADDDTLRSLIYDATSASPLNGLMRGRHTSLFSLSHNGRTLECGRVASIETDTGPVTAGDGAFDGAEPARGDWHDQIVRNGPTPKTDEATSYAGSSLAEHQDRILHVRGICTRRGDGIKQVEQQLFNPHGSIFHFLSDEASANGGSGRAPDAATYISAGIAFCFMTQFGRYAKITKKDLEDYRIVQDTHFSLGGATGGTARAGEADPVETHVFLRSGEDDAFARDALDMSEQTCFLHALCRTELKTRIRIRSGATTSGIAS
ncbi:MAG: OsmC family protein [Gammaproteobacteria bacterium]|nr:OsmC family protein [Gammaproteobacteria bacterium]